jgi:circadian clock protein KaiB
VPKHAFTVFVTGDTTRSQRAVSSFRSLCERTLGTDFEIDVVDVLVDTQLAEDHNVIATPMVIRTRPAPVRRALGDLADPDRVAAALGIDIEPESLAGRSSTHPDRGTPHGLDGTR